MVKLQGIYRVRVFRSIYGRGKEKIREREPRFEIRSVLKKLSRHSRTGRRHCAP